MPKSATIMRLLAVSLWLTAPGLADAWTPYGPGTYGPSPETAAPGTSGTQSGTTPETSPYPPYPSYPPFGPPPGMPRGFPGMHGPGMEPPRGFQISREATPDAYTLTIHLHGVKPDQVQIQTRGQWMRISEIGSQQQVQEDTFDQGRGYMHSYSYSTGTASRQFSVPRDGDLSTMKREDGKDTIRITIPRKKY
jgi:HSP20 family molecular chaperone IbpA